MSFESQGYPKLMHFESQEPSNLMLKAFAKSKKHSVVISGNEGVGKSHLAHKYAEYLGISRDFVIIRPTMEDIQNTLEELVEINTPTCICIENLDNGVIGVSYALLKFVEEPKENVYIVITCRNINKLPDTILSRCVSTHIEPPNHQDIILYCKTYYSSDYARLKDHILFSCISSFSDADIIMKLDADKLAYFDSIKNLLNFNDSVSNLSYKFSHYSDKSKLPFQILLKYIMKVSGDNVINWYAINCSDDILLGRIAEWAAINNFIFDCKNYKLKI